MVEVFKTNVQQTEEAKILIRKIANYFPKSKTNFDLSDCDKILRVEGENILPQKIIELLNSDNYQCIILE
jgi:hypothetical protein